jgi:hypothetical protein
MAKLLTREQAIKKGKQLRKFQTIGLRLHLITGSKKKSLRKEIFIDTEQGG